MKAFLKTISIIALSMVIGILWQRFKIFPLNHVDDWISVRLKLEEEQKEEFRHSFTSPIGYLITKYASGLPVFLDRSYYDELNNTSFDNALIIQFKRHTSDSIELIIDTDVILYRFVDLNSHRNIISKWTKENQEIKVNAHGIQLSQVYSKKFKKGTYKLATGENNISSPLLIDSKVIHNYNNATHVKIN